MIERRDVQRLERMVCFDDGADRFQMRAAGIAIRNGRVLVQAFAGDLIASLPGGRIDQHESSVAALVREMAEEFDRQVVIGPLAYVVESFFRTSGLTFHEVGFYYPMTVPDDFPYHDTDICHRLPEEVGVMEYRWVEATPQGLNACRLSPPLLRSRLAERPDSPVHLVDHRSDA